MPDTTSHYVIYHTTSPCLHHNKEGCLDVRLSEPEARRLKKRWALNWDRSQGLADAPKGK